MKHYKNRDKLKALERLAQGDDPQDICKEMTITTTTLRNWRKKALESNFLSQPHIGPKPSEKNAESLVYALQKHPNEQEPPEYNTGSIQVAAVLELNGHKMTRMSEGQRKVFYFKNNKEIKELEDKYWDGTLEASLYRFTTKVFEIMRNMKH